MPWSGENSRLRSIWNQTGRVMLPLLDDGRIYVQGCYQSAVTLTE